MDHHFMIKYVWKFYKLLWKVKNIIMHINFHPIVFFFPQISILGRWQTLEQLCLWHTEIFFPSPILPKLFYTTLNIKHWVCWQVLKIMWDLIHWISLVTCKNNLEFKIVSECICFSFAYNYLKKKINYPH